MRRLVGLFLILLFWLGPLSVLLQADDESRLPACCRRHGMHHCAMAASMTASRFVLPGSLPQAAAPMHCPMYPGSSAANTVPVYALIAPASGLPAVLAEAHSPAAGRAVARLSQLRTRANRGPPENLLG